MSNMIAETMRPGVRRVYGTPGDWLKGFTYALRHRRDMRWILVRHEEAAAFADTHLTSTLAVSGGSSVICRARPS